MSNDLAKRLNVRETVQEFHRAAALIRESYAKALEARRVLDQAFTMGGRLGGIRIEERYGREPHWDRPQDTIEQIEKQAWRAIVDRLELRRFLSVQRWEELSKMLEEGKMGELTEERAMQLLQSFAGQFDDLIAEAVTEVYDFLRPWNSRKKTNSTWRVGKQVILEGWLDHWRLPAYSVGYHYQQRITALENVFSSLDGKGQVSKAYNSQLAEAIKAAEDGQGETEYFRFKCFKNRNLHVEFKRADLVHELNRIAGSRCLAACREFTC